MQDYDVEQSYAKEEKLKQERVEDLGGMLGLIAKDGFVNIEPSTAEKNTNSEIEPLQEDYESEYVLSRNTRCCGFSCERQIVQSAVNHDIEFAQ